MSDIRIVAEFVLKSGQREALMPVLQALVSGSRAEAGNKGYDLTCSLENADHFFVIEAWASEEAIVAHHESPHFQAFVKATDGKTEKLVVNKLKQLL